MMKIDANGFAGTGDEIQSMEGFFIDMQKDIKKEKLSSPEQVKFFIDKFFNWFGEKWFSWTNKTDLVKRLKWCQENPWRKEVADVLYYSIVWQICHSFGRVHIPAQFESALLTWKDFFKNNLDTILQPDILTHSFGSVSYRNDYNNYSPKIERWEDCVRFLDKDLRQVSIAQLSNEERKIFQQDAKKFTTDQNYLNSSLYKLADDIEKNGGEKNKFKNLAQTTPSIDPNRKPPPGKVTWAKIKNAQVIDKVRQILEGKSIDTSENNYVPEYDPYDEPEYDPYGGGI